MNELEEDREVGEGGVLLDFYISVVLESSVIGLNPYLVSQNLSMKI